MMSSLNGPAFEEPEWAAEHAPPVVEPSTLPPSPAWQRSDPGGRFCVRYRFRSDSPSYGYVMRFSSPERRQAFIDQASAQWSVVIGRQWEAS